MFWKFKFRDQNKLVSRETGSKAGDHNSEDTVQNTQSTQSDSALHSELHTPEPAEPSIEPVSILCFWLDWLWKKTIVSSRLKFVSVLLQDKSTEVLSSEEELSQTHDEEDVLATSFENVRLSKSSQHLVWLLRYVTNVHDETIIRKYLQALVNAEKEEDTLTSQLEKEQDAALEAADQEEQSYLKAIEREESTEIMLDEEPDSLMVPTSLQLCFNSICLH